MSNSIRTTGLLVLALTLLIVGTPAVLGAIPAVPEIDPTTGVSALTLISGAVLLIRARRKK